MFPSGRREVHFRTVLAVAVPAAIAGLSEHWTAAFHDRTGLRRGRDALPHFLDDPRSNAEGIGHDRHHGIETKPRRKHA